MSVIKIGLTAEELVPPERNNKENERKVSLLSYTPDPLSVIYRAGKMSIGRFDDSNIKNREKKIKFVRKLIKMGHLSVLEHVSFTFVIRNISRVASHQLVRHRIASYTQQSFRYSKPNFGVFLPDGLKNNDKVIKYIEDGAKLYEELYQNGVVKEDARYVLPCAYTSDIIMTMNLREIIHFLKLRTSKYTQKELRDIAFQVYEIVNNIMGFDVLEE